MANAQDGKFVTGMGQLSAALRGIPEEMRGDVLRVAVMRACKPIEIAAKRYAKRSERTGALRAAITTKAVSYPKSGKAVGLVGPDRAYYNGRKKAGKLGALLLQTSRPANYAHLVEYGHHVVSPIKGTKRRKKTAVPTKNGVQWVAAKPFIRPAVVTTVSQQAQEFYNGILAGFEQAKRKYAK